MYKNSPLRSPLFIVGNPRSGTKLLRDLLNNHPLISLPKIETQFIPEFFKKWSYKGEQDFSTLFSYLKETHFFYRATETISFDKQELLEHQQKGSPAEFIELVLKYFSVKFQSYDDFQYIWGDKTPLYIRHVDVLREAFPDARFVHLIRDPRDIALSYRKTWNKSLYGAAEKWRSIMEYCESKGFQAKPWYLEVRYEDILTSSRDVLKEVCSFLDIPFEEKMNNLSSPVEKFGDAQNSSISKGNTKKYVTKMSEKEIRKIEQIVKKYLVQKNYELENLEIAFSPLSNSQITYYKIRDYFYFLHHLYYKEGGINAVAKNVRSTFKKEF